jgi:hypothetical protein
VFANSIAGCSPRPKNFGPSVLRISEVEYIPVATAGFPTVNPQNSSPAVKGATIGGRLFAEQNLPDSLKAQFRYELKYNAFQRGFINVPSVSEKQSRRLPFQIIQR